MSWTDQDFIKLKKRDPETLDKMYSLYKDNIYNYLLIKTRGNYTIAEDLFSETVQTAITSVHKLKNNKSLLGWLLKIASNKYNDYIRKQITEHKYLNKLDNEEAYTENYAEKIAQNEKTLLLEMAMDTINPKYKDILTMKYLEARSQKEIAAMTGKNIKAIESLLSRARSALKKELSKLSKEYFN